MSNEALEIRGSDVAVIEVESGHIKVRFEPAYLLKSEAIVGVDPSTRWQQTSQLLFREATLEGELPDLPATIETAKLQMNQHTYVDVVPLPIEMPGIISLTLTFKGRSGKVVINAGHVLYFAIDLEKCLEHLDQPEG